jgi:hypothetical protein
MSSRHCTIEAEGVGFEVQGSPRSIRLTLEDALLAGYQSVSLMTDDGMIAVRVRENGEVIEWKVS